MNKSLIIYAVLALFSVPMVLSSDLKESENRELISINIGDIVKALNGTIKLPTKNTTNTTNSTNTTTPTTPISNNTSSSNDTYIPPATNNTSNNNTSTIPVTNNTQPVANPNDSDAGSSDSDSPSTNTTNPTNSTNITNSTNPTTPTTPVSNNTNSTNTTTPVTPVKYAKNDVNMATFPNDCLTIHNQERVLVGLANLTWSDSLAAYAQTWAENMAKNGFRHSGKSGENIASSTYSTKTLSRLLGLWTNEKNYYIPGCKYGNCSSTSAAVGHYTQMVWAKTTQVGCGFAPGYNRGYNYLCCNYYKAGNVVGQEVYPYPIPTTTN